MDLRRKPAAPQNRLRRDRESPVAAGVPALTTRKNEKFISPPAYDLTINQPNVSEPRASASGGCELFNQLRELKNTPAALQPASLDTASRLERGRGIQGKNRPKKTLPYLAKRRRFFRTLPPCTTAGMGEQALSSEAEISENPTPNMLKKTTLRRQARTRLGATAILTLLAATAAIPDPVVIDLPLADKNTGVGYRQKRPPVRSLRGH